MVLSNVTSRLETESVGKLLWQYSLPAIVGTMVNSTYSVIDRIFIGHGVGAMAISGLAITLPILLLLQGFGMLIGAGSAARISISLGQKNKENAQKVLGNALVLTFLFTVPALTLAMIFMDPMLRAFGGSDQTIPYAKEFLYVLIPGNILAALSFGFNNIMRATGYPKKAMFTMLIGSVFNLILAPVFIFVLNLGIRGAAIATVISMGISAAWVMHHFFDKNSQLHFKEGIFRLDLATVWSIISIGMSPFLMQLAACLVNILINTSLKKYGGDLAVGAYGIDSSLALLIIMFIVGLNQGMQPVVGYNYGAGLYKRMLTALKYTVGIASIATSLGALCALLIPEWVVKAFTDDQEMIQIASNGLRILLCCFFVVGFQAVVTTFFQSIGMAWKSIFLSLTRQCLFLVPCLLILPLHFGLDGVWASGPVSDMLSALLTAVFLWIQIGMFNRRMTKLPMA